MRPALLFGPDGRLVEAVSNVECTERCQCATQAVTSCGNAANLQAN